MAINLRTGQPGHGKSFGAVRCIRDALEAGKIVVSNILLTDERTDAQLAAGDPPTWATVMARTNWFRRVIPGRCRKVALDFARRYRHVDDLGELQRYVLPPCGKCRGCRRGPGCIKEGRGVAVLDEAHRWLNARTWDFDETGDGTAKDGKLKRLSIVFFFTTHRHRGWDIELVTQDESNLDRQVRSLFETHTHLKNLRKFKLLGLVPVVPVNLFVAVKHWHDNDKTRLGVEAYLLNRKLARCYDTFGAGRHLAADPDAILLGQERRPDAAAGSEPQAAPDDAPAAAPVPEARAWHPGRDHPQPARPLVTSASSTSSTSAPPFPSQAVPSGPDRTLPAVAPAPEDAESSELAPRSFPGTVREAPRSDGTRTG